MKKFNILYIFALLFIMSACTKTIGTFDEDMSIAVQPEAPGAPVLQISSKCDGVELTWQMVHRTVSYKIYADGVLLTEVTGATSYLDQTATETPVLYSVAAANEHGEAASAEVSGRIAGTPLAPANFSATDGTAEDVVLTWDAAEFAESYSISRGGTVIADHIEETTFTDTEAPLVATEYSIVAHGPCSDSPAATDNGNGAVLVVTVDPFDDLTMLHDQSGVAINTEGAISGDASRLVLNMPSGYFVYNYSRITTFSFNYFYVSNDGMLGNPQVYVSPDGVDYTLVSVDVAVQNNGWRSENTITPTGTLPEGTNYLKVEMAFPYNDGDPWPPLWKDQIGSMSISHY